MALKMNSAEASISLQIAPPFRQAVTKKNRRNDPDRISLKKYDPVVRKHVEFREER